MPAVGATTFWMDSPPPVAPLRFGRIPLLAAAIAFALGLFLSSIWQPASWYIAALGLLLALTTLAAKKSLRIAPLPLLALFAVLGGWCAQMQPWPTPQTELLHYADGLSRTIRARVLRIRYLPPRRFTRNAGEATQPWLLEPGEWESDPTAAPTESIDLAVDSIEYLTPDISTMVPITGGVRITLLDAAPTLHCGDRIELPLRLRLPETYRDAGVTSYADQLLAEGISTHATAHASKLQLLAAEKPTLHCRLYAAQTWASARLAAFVHSRANLALPPAARLSPEDAVMLSAMLFGDRSGLRSTLRLGFERTGTFHLFVVSGLHVGILAGLLFWSLRRLRASRGLATFLTIALTTAYTALTGFGIPAQRALLMAAVFLIARWLWRDISILQAIGAAALAVLAHDPRAAATASFQMTFLALLAVGALAVPLIERLLQPHILTLADLDSVRPDPFLHPCLTQRRVLLRLLNRALAAALAAPLTRRRHRRAAKLPTSLSPRKLNEHFPPSRLERFLYSLGLHLLPTTVRLVLRLAELILVALTVEAAMSLPMALYFHRATPFALPANLFSVPLIAILAPLAVVTFAAILLNPWLATIPAALTALSLHAIHGLITLLSHARIADLRVPGPTPLAIALALAALTVAAFALHKRSPTLAAFGVASIALIPLFALYPTPPTLHPNALEVTALDVGQGDSLFLASPATASTPAHTLLVDAGGPVGQSYDPDRFDTGESIVAPFLWSRHLRRLDAVALSHAHSDHMGGLPAILRDFRPRELWLSLDTPESADFRSLLAQAAQQGIRIRTFRAGDNFDFGSAHVTVLSPDPTYRNGFSPRNDDSLVLRFDYGQSSALLAGDAERPSEATMLATHRLAPVTLLKVGHHGSRTSTTPEFLAALTPQVAIISDGRTNTFGHPRPEVLQRLEDQYTQTWRTDRQGAHTFLLSPNNTLTDHWATNDPTTPSH